MKNSNNKVIAGIVCGIVVGSVGTSFVGNFQGTTKQVALNSQSNIGNSNQFNDSINQFDNSSNQFKYYEKHGRGDHHGMGNSLAPTDSIEVANGNYSDGTYQGTASGHSQGLTVQVKISGGKISNIDITSHNETPGFYEQAFEVVPAEIIQKQSTGVDTVSGATQSSIGIINAVNNALNQANTTQNSTTNNSNLNLETEYQ